VTGTEVEPAEPDTTITGQELVHVPAAVTLFRTDEPGEIIARATAVANALSAVLEAKKLYKRIGERNHVFVEGWTLCGSMLGVFPTVVWSRKLVDGWEARAEAVTMTGAVVGAAEAQCSRAEEKWRTRDEYALRSMAQTRAISKAMKLPLGFIVVLAGFDATPAEEMIEERGAKAQPLPESPDFDPGEHLLPGAIPGGDDFLVRLGNRFSAIDATVGWRQILDEQLGRQRWEADGNGAQFWRRVANAVEKVGDTSSFPPPSDETIQHAFAWAFDGIVIELVRPVAEELDEEAREALARDLAEDEVVEGEVVDEDDEPAPLGSGPIPEVGDDDPDF
jgi:hypothetical protein